MSIDNFVKFSKNSIPIHKLNFLIREKAKTPFPLPEPKSKKFPSIIEFPNCFLIYSYIYAIERKV